MAPPRGPFPARLSDPEVEWPSLAGAWTASSGRAAPHLARLGHQLDLRNPSRSISAIWFGGITRGERADLNPDLRSSAGWSSGIAMSSSGIGVPPAADPCRGGDPRSGGGALVEG